MTIFLKCQQTHDITQKADESHCKLNSIKNNLNIIFWDSNSNAGILSSNTGILSYSSQVLSTHFLMYYSILNQLNLIVVPACFSDYIYI